MRFLIMGVVMFWFGWDFINIIICVFVLNLKKMFLYFLFRDSNFVNCILWFFRCLVNLCRMIVFYSVLLLGFSLMSVGNVYLFFVILIL